MRISVFNGTKLHFEMCLRRGDMKVELAVLRLEQNTYYTNRNMTINQKKSEAGIEETPLIKKD